MKKHFCGSFSGECVYSDNKLENLEVEETVDEIEFEIPVRTLKIENFEKLEGEKVQTDAVYLSDLNLVSDEVIVCGTIEDIRERSYTNKKGIEKFYY